MEKIAIIEIDSRSLKLTLAKNLSNGQYLVYDGIFDSVKLGEDLGKDNFFKANRVNETIAILKGYKKLCDAEGIEKVECVVLEDCKLAKNLKSFVDEISTHVGIKVRVLDTDEEQKYNYTGVLNTLEVPKGVIVKVGFESTSIIKYIRRSITAQKIIPYGICTLAEKFAGDKNLVQKSYEFFSEQIKGCQEFSELDPELSLVGIGEMFTSFAKISRMAKKYSYDKTHGYQMNKKDVDGVYDFFKTLDLDSKQKIRGISSDRADFVAAGVGIIKAVCDFSNSELLTISERDLTDGILNTVCETSSQDRPITDILGHSLLVQKVSFPDSMKNSMNVYELAMILYKQLRVLHKLPRTFVKVLRVASFFYDSGSRISFYGGSKNSFSVVLNADLFGLTHREQVLAAFVCASQDSNDFNLAEFVKYRDILTQEDLDAVKKLAVIVRIAKGLDRCGSGVIKDITCDILGDSVILKAIMEDGDASFEIKDAMKAEADFKKAFKKNLEIL